MKKIVLLAMGLFFLPLIASAYQVSINAPETLTVGKPLVVTGNTTFPPGMSVDVVLYYQLTTTTEIKRQVVGIKPDRTFKVVFDTTDLKTGTYKVEVPVNGMGDSVTMRLVRIVDRSEEIQLDSPLNQQFSGKLLVAGSVKGDPNSGVQIEVIGPDNAVVFGPQFVPTDSEGSFMTNVPISVPGDYEISFTDAKGFVGTRIITASGPQTPVPSLAETIQSRTVVSAHARASRDTPAYFSVNTNPGLVTLYTSPSFDWIIEFVDENGVLHVENNQDPKNPGKAVTEGSGKIIFVKIYPSQNTQQGEVSLFAENANAISVSPTVPAPFAAAAPQASGGFPSAAMTPFPILAALAIISLLMRR